MDSMMSAACIGNKAMNFVSFIIWCIFYSWIITFQDFYSCFRHIFRIFSFLIFNWSKTNVDRVNVSTSRTSENSVGIPTIEAEDVEIVMKSLGLYQEPLQGSIEIANVFDKNEPCLNEVREAFSVFDENNDGFIDAKELKKVMCSIGLKGYSSQECQKMIMTFDENGDGRIDFGEFVKLMEECC